MALDWVDGRGEAEKQEHPIDGYDWKRKALQGLQVVPIIIRINQQQSPQMAATLFTVEGNEEGVKTIYREQYSIPHTMLAQARYEVLEEIITDRTNHMVTLVAEKIAKGRPWKIVKKYNRAKGY